MAGKGMRGGGNWEGKEKEGWVKEGNSGGKQGGRLGQMGMEEREVEEGGKRIVRDWKRWEGKRIFESEGLRKKEMEYCTVQPVVKIPTYIRRCNCCWGK